MSTRLARWRHRLRRARYALPYLAGKLLRLRPIEWRDLILAQLAIFWALALVWLRPVGRLAEVDGAAGKPPAPGGDRVPEATEMTLARRLALAVDRAASFGPTRPLCLARAVALNRLLELHGVRGSRIRIGVVKQGSAFAAHAWVEYGGQVLADHEWYVSKYSELTDIRIARSA